MKLIFLGILERFPRTANFCNNRDLDNVNISIVLVKATSANKLTISFPFDPNLTPYASARGDTELPAFLTPISAIIEIVIKAYIPIS